MMFDEKEDDLVGSQSADLTVDDYIAQGNLSEFPLRDKGAQNIYAALLAASAHPEETFKRLLSLIDIETDLPFWLADSHSATADIAKATGWEGSVLDPWQNDFERLSAWKEITIPPRDLPLTEQGTAFASEVEVFNRGKLEKKSQHTTDIDALILYFQRIQDYMEKCADLFPAHYFWNMHLSASWSRAEARNIKIKAFSNVFGLMVFPTNPFGRNQRISSSAYELLKLHTTDHDFLSSDLRCPTRTDSGRMEFRGFALSKDTDLNYVKGIIICLVRLGKEPRDEESDRIDVLRRDIRRIYREVGMRLPQNYKILESYTKEELDRETRKFNRDTWLMRALIKQRVHQEYPDLFPEAAPRKRYRIPLPNPNTPLPV